MLNKTNYFSSFFYVFIALGLLTILSQNAYAHGMSEADKLAIIEGGNLRYLWLGATHMLSGYDHLAFVFGIIFFLTSFRDIAKYVTAFTLGHSVTLIFATFNAIQINYYAIDAIIGLSVCYIAFANIDGFRKYLNINPPNMLLMIVGLGLIHGFGLSTRLQELPLSQDDLLLNIISFNVGVELGQISALALMLVVLAAWRKTHAYQTFSLVANYFLILAGGFLFLMQMHGYEHATNPDEFSVISTAKLQKVSSPNLDQENWTDTINITIPARGDKEYKLYISEGATFTYSWDSDQNQLFFDFHGEPAGDTSGYFKSFEKDTDSQSGGSLTAEFNGTHGWYWKNESSIPANITLKLKGQYKRPDSSKDKVVKPANKTNADIHDSID